MMLRYEHFSGSGGGGGRYTDEAQLMNIQSKWRGEGVYRRSSDNEHFDGGREGGPLKTIFRYEHFSGNGGRGWEDVETMLRYQHFSGSGKRE